MDYNLVNWKALEKITKIGLKQKEGGTLRKKKMLTALPRTEGYRSNWSSVTTQNGDWITWR